MFSRSLLTASLIFTLAFVSVANVSRADISDVIKLLNQGYSPLMIAASNGKSDVVRELVDEGHDVNKLGPNGVTALMLYCASGYAQDSETVGFLLDKGASIDAQSNSGQTALMMAAYLGHYQQVELLLNRGANANLKTGGGRTALAMAREKGHTEVVKLLQASGSRVDENEKFRRKEGQQRGERTQSSPMSVTASSIEGTTWQWETGSSVQFLAGGKVRFSDTPASGRWKQDGNSVKFDCNNFTLYEVVIEGQGMRGTERQRGRPEGSSVATSLTKVE